MEHNDYELVFLAREGNEDAINLIYQKYKPIIIKKSKNAIVFASHHGIEINDIMQEGFIGLDEAIRDFSQDTEATFYTFANLCIDRQIANYLKKMTSGKDRILNDAITINDSLEKTMRDGTDIEKYFIFRDNNEEITANIRQKLTNFEKKVFDLRLKGYSFEEIANILNKDMKAIYNTFFRIKEKIKKNIKIDD
jgi:RNA polymerase sporulation-specific sigma factor